jgi:hypothetical protein
MASNISIPNDLGTILRLPAKVTTELTDKACLCIGSAIASAKNAGEEQTSINIGIGLLCVNLLDMQCKFVPSKGLKIAIKEALTDNIDPLEVQLEQLFTERLLSICEEVL